MRGRMFPTRTLFLALSTLLLMACLFACAPKEGKPGPVSILGQRVVVWDAVEPQYAGTKGYEESVLALAEAFGKAHEVEVAVRFVTRQEIDGYLAGTSPETDPPALVYSTEWPALRDAFADLAANVEPASYIDAASAYWTSEGRLLGIPAYIHWVGTAVYDSLSTEVGEAATGAGDAAEENVPGATWLEEIAGKTGYWHDSPAFLPAVLDWPDVGWAGSFVTRYLDWVKETYGPIREDPLVFWQDEEARALFPVTPFFCKWLGASDRAGLSILPVAGPFAPPRFYYTVPGYVVLAGEEARVVCAAMFGKELAANLGKWAARALGAVPALADDMPLFHLEGGFGYEWRIAILKELEQACLKAPSADVMAQRARTAEVVSRLAKEYHNGTVSREELEREIDGILATHTRP